MLMEHAPITGILLGVSAYCSVVTPRSYLTARPLPTTPQGWTATVQHLPLLSVPFGSLGLSPFDIGCALLILLQMRTLERRWGSSSFLTFVVVTALLGSILTSFLVTQTTPPLSLEQLQVLSAAGSLVPLSSLVTRFTMELPSLHAWQLPFLPVAVTEKVTVILPLLRLVSLPETEGLLRIPRQRGSIVRVDVGLRVRLALVLAGVLFGLASSGSRPLARFLGLVSRRISNPLLRLLRPFLDVVGGPSVTVTQTLPKRGSTRQFVAGGRYALDNLSGIGADGDDFQYPLHGTAIHRRNGIPRQRGEEYHRRQSQPRNQWQADGGDVVPDELIAQVMELGMGFDVDTIRAALIASNGRPDVAINMLVGN
ncbi:unnamed protein product [Trypanosoma congolense IL3000]|uniref:WGS project CAEQ00000000 data, annotated contig 271 n=1 Tax=Trypanosoma congolense (strain IL3000) TaxID=1068625 RepID=F9WEI4_TRYCI|nr:unnamed protein product [Trypanosoma congolense IL3000]